MAENHLEQLVAEWYEFKGYVVRRNVHVGKLPRGGYECELDVIAFNPQNRHLVHVEASNDADSWETRDRRFRKKFLAGRKYIPKIFAGLPLPPEGPDQIALFTFAAKNTRDTVGGGQVLQLQEFLKTIVDYFSGYAMTKEMVPERFGLIRTIQIVTEYKKRLFE